jgi:tetratricopeptide (TPR) repeat protein
MNSFEDLIQQCDLALRAGRAAVAAKLLRSLIPSKVPRSYRLPLARICRRCDSFALGMKLLTPVIYPEKKGSRQPPSGAELAEFAALRMKIGSVDEALAILSRIDGANVLEAPLLRAFCHMAQWDYAPATEELKNYLALGPEPYPALVARVNLAASLISIQQFDEATDLLAKLIEDAKAGGFDRLRANCHELRSQIHLERGCDSECEQDLNSASLILTLQKTADQLYVQKWQAVLKARRTGSQEPLLVFKKEALARQSWENLREVDFQLLKIKFDHKLFQHLKWGTPYKAYRERICRILEQDPNEVENHYVFGDVEGRWLDLRTAKVSAGHLNPGKQVHRLLAILLKDFYRPISVGALYADLFPGEHYNIFSSPDRVHQALRRTRRWLEQQDVLVEIKEFNGQFALRLEGPVAFVLGPEPKAIDSQAVILERLRSAVRPDQSFSSPIVSEITELSLTSTVRFLNWALQSGYIVKSGLGRSTKYCFVEPQQVLRLPFSA